MEPQSLKDIIPEVIKKFGMQEKFEECEALPLWEKAFPNLASTTQAVAISRGKITIVVANSVIMHQMTFFKRDYIDRINTFLGKRLVKDIHFRVGKIDKPATATKNKDNYIKEIESIELDQKKLEKIEETVARMDDAELREALRAIFIGQCKLDEMRRVGKVVD